MNEAIKVLKKGFGLVRGLQDEFVQACLRTEVPLEALQRLVSPKGRETWDAIARLITDHWHAELPKLAHHDAPTGGHPFRGTPIGDARNVIEVPDLDAVDLTALTKSHCGLMYLDSDYAKWDFHRGIDGNPISGRGKRFEVMTWEPKRHVKSDEVRAYFKERGFYGHTGAFTAFIKERKPKGCHASIPEDNGCWRSSDGRLYVPYSNFNDSDRGLIQGLLDSDWASVCWVFVAFREL
ncbi:hypothetical protein KBD13_01760 [Patescibacteria group bacterium]|nr:hypothetical protein [Patescibacteria group bacterium]